MQGLQGTPNNKVTLLCLSLHHWPELLPAQGAGRLPLCKQPCILQLTSAGCCSVDMSSYDGKMAQRQMMQTVLQRELSKPLSFETSLIWMFHCKCFKQGFSSKVTASTKLLTKLTFELPFQWPTVKNTYPHLPCGISLHMFSSSFAPQQ